jgi:transposase
MAYDEKFRLRLIEYKDSGHTFKEVYEAFGVDSQRYYCWKKQLDETGSVKFHAPKGRDRKIDKAELLRLPDEHPDWYLKEFAEVSGGSPFRKCPSNPALPVKKHSPILKSQRKNGKSI